MSKDFEQQAKKQGENFSLQPREQVWLRVEAALDEKKRRGVAWWWWALPLVLLLGSGLAYYFYDSKQTAPVVATNHPERKKIRTNDRGTENISIPGHQPALPSSTIATTTHKKPNTQPGEESTNNQPFRGLDQRTTHTSPSNTRTPSNPAGSTIAAESQQPGLKNNVDETAPTIQATLSTGSPATPEVIAGVPVAKESSVAVNSQTTADSNLASLPAIVTTGEVAETVESLNTTASPEPVNPLEQTAPVDSSTQAATTNKSVVLPNIRKKATWYVLAGIGKSRMGEFDIIPGGGEKAFASDPLQSGNVGSGVPNSTPVKSDEPGIAYSLMAQRRQPLGKRWQWQAGLGWQYQQISQYLGNKVDSTLYLDASRNLSNAFFYQPGSSSSEKGTNHRLLLSNDFSWQVLKNQSWLRLSAGIYTGFNISNDYYVRDNAQRMVKNDGLYSNWFLGFTPGIEFVILKKWTIGAQAHYDFTKAYKELNATPQYWKGWEIKAGIPIFTK
jgi:hypothetical protein